MTEQAALIPEPPRQLAADIPADWPADPATVGDGFLASNGLRLRELGEDGECETLYAFGHVDRAAFRAAAVEYLHRDAEAHRAAGLDWMTAGDVDQDAIEHVTWRLVVPWCAQRLDAEMGGTPDPDTAMCAPDACVSEHCAPWGFSARLDRPGVTYALTVLEG